LSDFDDISLKSRSNVLIFGQFGIWKCLEKENHILAQKTIDRQTTGSRDQQREDARGHVYPANSRIPCLFVTKENLLLFYYCQITFTIRKYADEGGVWLLVNYFFMNPI